MSNKRFYTFIIVQPNQLKVRKLLVPHFVIRSLVLVCFLGLGAAAMGLPSLGRMAGKAREFDRLRAEFRNLKIENKHYESSTTQLLMKFSLLEALAQKLTDAMRSKAILGNDLSRRIEKGALPDSTLAWPCDVHRGSSSDQLRLMSHNADRLDGRFRLLQNFYEKVLLREIITPSTWPVRGIRSDRFGLRRSLFDATEEEFHNGIDISAPQGEEVYAPAYGTVVSMEHHPAYGKFLLLDHGFDICTLFAHLTAFNVRPGQKVTRGQVIAFVGATGRATGPHLHYEVRLRGNPVNPLRYLPKPS